jgi:hypothetical protein
MIRPMVDPVNAELEIVDEEGNAVDEVI